MTDARKDPVFGKLGADSEQIHNQYEEQERLMTELREYTENVSPEAFDVEKVNAILDALNKLDLSQKVSEEDTEKALTALHVKHSELLGTKAAQSAAMIPPSPTKKRSRLTVFKIIPIAAILVIILSTIFAQAFNLGSLFSLFTRSTSEAVHIGGEVTPNATITAYPLEIGEEATYDTPEEAIDAFGIHENILPQGIPERFALEEVSAMNRSSSINIYIDYSSGDGFLSIRYREITPDAWGYEQESPQRAVRDVAGLRHVLVAEEGRYKAYWENGDLLCTISGTVSKEEMEQIIDSIYE